MKNLFYPVSKLFDFSETVTVHHHRNDAISTVRRATQVHPGKSETGFLATTTIPHIKTIWFLPCAPRFEPQRGDRIFDAAGRKWILVEPILYNRFGTWRCRCLHETLAPATDDYADLFRANSLVTPKPPAPLPTATLVAENIVAIQYPRTETSQREKTETEKSVHDRIVFQTNVTIPILIADVLRRKNRPELYEILSYEEPSVHSDWGKITARRIATAHGTSASPALSLL